MRHPSPSTMIVAATLAIVGAPAPLPALAQAPAQPQAPAMPQPQAIPGPYNVVPIKPPAPVSDASFEPFRKQLTDIAQKKDRAALARLVAANFFWIPEDSDVADKSKPGIDTLAKAIGLDGQDAFGWDVLAEYATETTATPDPQRQGVICAPGEPAFDEKAADEIANATQTDATDWIYPTRDGVEVRALDNDSPANAVTVTFVKVAAPSGKSGYVPVDAVRAVVGPQMCYAKDASGWKIAGFVGGDPSHAN
jgi:hypothetical protein